MFKLRYVLAASVGACLLGGAALGQPASTSATAPTATQDQSARVAPAAIDRATQASAMTTEPATATVTATVDANGVRHLIIASPPVPDTPENRAKYGQPLSNAGRRTQPAGN